MKNLSLFLALSILVAGCQNQDENKPEPPKHFPVVSFIKSQVAHVDTSLYPIIRINVNPEGPNDTSFHKREEFRSLAKDFMDLPDITDKKMSKRFTKESRYDESLGRLIITMLPVNPAKEEIQREEVLIKPDPSGDRVMSIIIDYSKSNRDSAVQKRLLWIVDESFQVSTIKQLKAQPEMVNTFRVVWNEPAPEAVFTEEEVKENK
jgi:hypothetical protein